MSEDLTKAFPSTDSEKLTLILTTVQLLTVRVDGIDTRLQRVEQTMDDARPVWRLLPTEVAHLREGQTQLEAGQRRLEQGYTRLEKGYARLEQGQAHLEQGYARLEQGQARLEQGYARLEQGQARLDERCGRLEQGMESLHSELQAFRRVVDYRFMILSGKVLETYRGLERRVTVLELNSNPPGTQT